MVQHSNVRDGLLAGKGLADQAGVALLITDYGGMVAVGAGQGDRLAFNRIVTRVGVQKVLLTPLATGPFANRTELQG